MIAWEQLGLDRGLNPLLGVMDPEAVSRLTECQRVKGCESGLDHWGPCIVPHGANGPWEVHQGEWHRTTRDPGAFRDSTFRRLMDGITG